MSGARAAVLVAGTAASVGAAMMGERRLVPSVAGSGGQTVALPDTLRPPRPRLPDVHVDFGPHLRLAALLALGMLAAVAAIPAVTAITVGSPGSPPAREVAGPPAALRAASGVTGDWARSYASSAPSPGDLGAAMLAAAGERQKWDALRYMVAVQEQAQAEQARQAAASARSLTVRVSQPADAAAAGVSGYAPGTVLNARITIYGCAGPGGGFCGGMSSGFTVYEGAVACSYNLPFGTKLTIEGDPTGRVYECLDRGALSNTWVDVFFNDTAEGMAWASQLGGTTANITIVN